MFQHILVPLDGSTRAERAIPVAAYIARASAGSVVDPPLEFSTSLAPSLPSPRENPTHAHLTQGNRI